MRFPKIFSLILVSLTASLAFAEEPATLKLVKTISLSGVRGRLDHFSIDSKGERLFVAALSNNSLEVLDISAGKLLKSVLGLKEPQGVAFLDDSNQIVVAGGGDGSLHFISGASYEFVKTVGSLDDADNVRFDPKRKLIYVGYGEGGMAIVDPSKMTQTRNIKLSAHPESFQLEQAGSRIFVNVPGAKEIAVIDREKESVIQHWPLKDFNANFPMALNEEQKRLFVGCRSPAQFVVFDIDTGKTVSNLPTCGDADDLYYDAAPKRIYISCGEGFLDVIQQNGQNAYRPLERIKTRAGARTSFFSPQRRELFLGVPARGNYPAEIRVFKTQR